MSNSSKILRHAEEFFAPIRTTGRADLRLAASSASGTSTQPDGNSSVFTPGPGGTLSALVLVQEAPEDLQGQVDTNKQNLINLTGLASAYVRGQANSQNNPNLVYDTTLWQTVFNHLPLMGPSSFTAQSFSESMQGVQIATSFIQTIVGFAVQQGPALSSFASFLQGLGSQISAGVNTKNQSYSTGIISVVITVQNNMVVPTLNAYFVNFTASESTVYSNCASADVFNVSFDYREENSLFNAGALNDPQIAAKFNALIQNSQIDDIQSAQNFFAGTVTPASS